MYLSFSTLPSLRTNAPQFVASFDDGFSGLTKYLLDSGKKALADIRSSSLAGRVNWKIALPVCLLVLAATSCIFYLAKRNNALKAEVESLAANKAIVTGLAEKIGTLRNEKEKLALELKQKTEELSKDNADLNEVSEVIDSLEATVEPLQNELDSLKGVISTANTRIEELSKPNPRIAELEDMIEQLNAKISSFETEVSPDQGEAASTSGNTSKRKTKDPAAEITKLQAEVDTVRAQLRETRNNLQKERASSDDSLGKLRALEKVHADYKKEQSEIFGSCVEQANKYIEEIRQLKAQLGEGESF